MYFGSKNLRDSARFGMKNLRDSVKWTHFTTIYSKDFGAKNEWKCIILHKNCGIVQDFA